MKGYSETMSEYQASSQVFFKVYVSYIYAEEPGTDER
jgi:hypothetical protein